MDKAKVALHPEVNRPEVRAERNRLAQTLQIGGTPERVKEFLYMLGVRDEIAE